MNINDNKTGAPVIPEKTQLEKLQAQQELLEIQLEELKNKGLERNKRLQLDVDE